MPRWKPPIPFARILRWTLAIMLGAFILLGVGEGLMAEHRPDLQNVAIGLFVTCSPHVLMILWLVGVRIGWLVWLALAGWLFVIGAVALLVYVDKAQNPTTMELAYLGSLVFLCPILCAALWESRREPTPPKDA